MSNDYNSDRDAQISKWQQCMGRFVRYHPVIVTSNHPNIT